MLLELEHVVQEDNRSVIRLGSRSYYSCYCCDELMLKRAVAQWYSQRTYVLEVAGSIPAPVIVGVGLTENQS